MEHAATGVRRIAGAEASVDGVDAASSVGRSTDWEPLTPMSKAASLEGRDLGMEGGTGTEGGGSGANDVLASPRRRGPPRPKEIPLDSRPFASVAKEAARSPPGQRHAKFQSKVMLEEVSPRKAGSFHDIPSASWKQASEEREAPTSGRLTPPAPMAPQPVERSSSASQGTSPILFRSILKKNVLTSRAPPFVGNAEDNDDDGGELRLTTIGRVASADYASPRTRRASRTEDPLGLTARRGRQKEDYDEEGDAIYYYQSDHHGSRAARESFTDLDLDTAARNWDGSDGSRRPRRIHQRSTTDSVLFADPPGVVGSYRTAGSAAGAIRQHGPSDQQRGASFRAQQRTLHANLAQQWYLQNYDRWSSTSRHMHAENHAGAAVSGAQAEQLSWSAHDPRLDTARAGFDDAGIVISNIESVGSPEVSSKTVTGGGLLGRDRVGAHPHSDHRRQRSLSVNDRPSSGVFVADTTLPMEIMEGTPAAEALRANADVRVTKIDKLARKLNMQTVPRVIKKVVVAPAKAVVGAERGKPPRVPSARPFGDGPDDAHEFDHDDVGKATKDDDGDRTHDLDSLEEEDEEDDDDDDDAPYRNDLTTLEEGTERDEATLDQSPGAEDAPDPPQSELQRFVSDVTVPDALRPQNDLLQPDDPNPPVRPQSPLRKSWNPTTPNECDAPDVPTSPRSSPMSPQNRLLARFSYRDYEEGLADRHADMYPPQKDDVETSENQGKKRSSLSPGLLPEKGRGGVTVKVVDDAKGSSPMRRRLTGDFRPFHERRWKTRGRLKKKKSSRKSYVKGKVIDGEHELYTLSIAVMLGLRTSIGVTNSELMNPANRNKWLDLEDFMAVEKYVFKPKGGPKTPPHQLSHTFKFKDYSPVAFAYIRRMFGVNEYEFLLSVCGNANFIEFISNAKSGQFFFYSSDGKYMIKTMTNAESKFLRRILPHYFRHCSQNPSTLITKFLGMYRVKMYHLKRNVKFIIMNSVFDTDKVLSSFYDLKGSTLGREAKPGETVKKDNDVRRGMPHTSFALRRDIRERMRAQVIADTNFLRDMKILDYSMLIGVHQMPTKRGRPLKQPLFASDRKFSQRFLDIPDDKPSSAPTVYGRRASKKGEEERGPECDESDRGDSVNHQPLSDTKIDADNNARASLSTGDEEATLESQNAPEKSTVVRFGGMKEDKTDSQSVDSFATLDQFFDDDDDFSYLDGGGRPGGRNQDGDFADIDNLDSDKQGEMDEIQRRMEETVEHMYWPYHRLYDIYGRRRMKEMPLPKQQPSKGRKRMEKWKIANFEPPISNRKDGGLVMDTSLEDSPETDSSRRQETELMDGKIFYMGIIDILQVYNVRKRLEARLRRLQGAGWEGASCVPPALYGDRFVRFFDEYSQHASPFSYQPLGSEDDSDVRGDENLGGKVEI